MNPSTTVRRRLASTAVAVGAVGFTAIEPLRRRPYRLYRAAQRLDPVHQNPLGIWLVTRHADVATALRNPRLGNDERKGDTSVFQGSPIIRFLNRNQPKGRVGPFLEAFSDLMLFRDPPDHTRLRRLVSKAFTPKRAEALAPRVAELTDELLAPALRRRSMDLMADLAYPLPAQVICELLGVPSEDRDLFVRCAPALAVGLDPSPMRTASALADADRAVADMTDYLDDLIVRRRQTPTDDLLSALIAAEDEGDRLSHAELTATVILLLIAGHETTANLVGNGTRALLRHPDQAQRLRDDPDLDRSAVEELLRFDSPVQMTLRTALEAVSIGDVTIEQGRAVVLCLGAANRDPAVFDDPNQLDIGRDPNPHLSFGAGAHFCLGAPLARVEARVVIPTLLRRLPGLRLAGRPARRPSFTIRGFRRLPLAW